MNDGIASTEFEVIREEEAIKLREYQGEVKYELGMVNKKLAFRITGNVRVNVDEGVGTFWTKPIPLSQIKDCLGDRKVGSVGSFTSNIFKTIGQGNRNTKGFILAILKHEGLIEKSVEGRFNYKLAFEIESFLEKLNEPLL